MPPADRNSKKEQDRRGPRRPGRSSRLVAIVALAAIGGCDFVADLLSDPPESRHARYVEGLANAGLAATPSAQAWIDAGQRALDGAAPEALPIRRSGWFDADSVGAIGVRFVAPAQDWVTIRARLSGANDAQLFIDAFRMPADTERAPEPVASAGDSTRLVWFRVRGQGDYVVRIQPELLRGGAWELEVVAADEEPDGPTLALGRQ